MREIKFNYIFKDQEGKFHRLTETIEQIEGCIDVSWNIHNGWKLIARREYTGLKDKNGKEIYEGDILDSREEVVWVNNGWFKKDLEKSWEEFLQDDVDTYDECQTRLNEDNNYEVIGNIYENPELLTKEE